MSHCKYDSRMSQHYLNQNLILSATYDLLKIGPLVTKTKTKIKTAD